MFKNKLTAHHSTFVVNRIGSLSSKYSVNFPVGAANYNQIYQLVNQVLISMRFWPQYSKIYLHAQIPPLLFVDAGIGNACLN